MYRFYPRQMFILDCSLFILRNPRGCLSTTFIGIIAKKYVTHIADTMDRVRKKIYGKFIKQDTLKKQSISKWNFLPILRRCHMVSYEHYVVSFHWPLTCLFRTLSRLTRKPLVIRKVYPRHNVFTNWSFHDAFRNADLLVQESHSFLVQYKERQASGNHSISTCN